MTKSPFAPSFYTAMKKGASCTAAVAAIASKARTSTKNVYNSLWKAGWLKCQKFNGHCIYWPSFSIKTSPSSAKACQSAMWQCFVDWCITSGCCTPKQLTNNTGSQSSFMSFCRKFFGNQFSSTSTSSWSKSKSSSWNKSSSKKWSKKRTATKARKSSSRKSRPAKSRKSSSARSYKSTSYRFPNFSAASRRYRRAA